MRKFKDVNELVNVLKPDYPVYCIRQDSIKNSTKFIQTNPKLVPRSDQKQMLKNLFMFQQ